MSLGNLVFFGAKKKEYYKDILIKADLGLHSQVFDRIKALVQPGSKILDVGAGEGAFSQRLVDAGYEVYSLDVDEDNFRCKGAKFLKINFDNPGEFESFIDNHREFFDAIVCLEVIEHVENQWDLSRSIQKMLKAGGNVVLTTPNITSWFSRLYFLFKGKFHQFDESDFSYGHINPVSGFHLRYIMDNSGWQNLKISKGGTLPLVWINSSVFLMVLNVLAILLRPFQKGLIDGWCLILTAQKSL